MLRAVPRQNSLKTSPTLPAIFLLDDVGVFLTLQRGLNALVLLKTVEVFQEQEPGGLLNVVEFGCAACLFPRDVVDVLKCLLKRVINGSPIIVLKLFCLAA
jgi:hypothetical protein